MVMRNRCDGGGPPGWWDDLPPRVRDRFAGRPAAEPVGPPAGQLVLPPEPAPVHLPLPAGPSLALDLARLAVAFLAVVAAHVLFLLVALSFLSGGPLPIPGR